MKKIMLVREYAEKTHLKQRIIFEKRLAREYVDNICLRYNAELLPTKTKQNKTKETTKTLVQEYVKIHF